MTIGLGTQLRQAEHKIIGLKRRIAGQSVIDSHELIELDRLKAKCKKLRDLIAKKEVLNGQVCI